jgi:hypothetical protein
MNEKTDAFAFGVIIVELLTGLLPQYCRELIDDTLPEDLPMVFKAQHDFAQKTKKQQTEYARLEKANQKNREDRLKFPGKKRRQCGAWPPNQMDDAIKLATKATRAQSRHRLGVGKAIPELEQLLADWERSTSGPGGSSMDMSLRFLQMAGNAVSAPL